MKTVKEQQNIMKSETKKGSKFHKKKQSIQIYKDSILTQQLPQTAVNK